MAAELFKMLTGGPVPDIYPLGPPQKEAVVSIKTDLDAVNPLTSHTRRWEIGWLFVTWGTVAGIIIGLLYLASLASGD